MSEEEVNEVEEKENVEEESAFSDSASATDEVEVRTSKDDSHVSVSVGTGKTVFNGFCKLCGARIANAVQDNGKFTCPTCKGDF